MRDAFRVEQPLIGKVLGGLWGSLIIVALNRLNHCIYRLPAFLLRLCGFGARRLLLG